MYNVLFLLIGATLIQQVSVAQVNRNVSLFGRSLPTPYRYSGSWGYVAANGREYGLVGGYGGTHVIAIDDSTNIRQVGFVAGPESNWREITVVGNHAFVVSEGGGPLSGMQVISLATLPDSVRLVTTYRATFTTGHIIMRDISTDSAFVYVSGASGTGGVHILNVSNPASPVQVGVYDPPYYIHDTHIRGTRLYASAGGQRKVDIVDISNKRNPTFIASINYPGAYTHSCWTTEDSKFLFVADEQDGQVARIWNIESLSRPTEVAQYTANLQSLVHNPYILGRYAFLSHNTEGLRVVDIADPSVPIEVGYYDTYPGPSGGFNGLWSACPYLPSGKIIGGDRTGGLYIWKFNGRRAVRIYGIVRDDRGSPIPFARITISHSGRTTLADSTGGYKIGEERLEPPGIYAFKLYAFAQGYMPDSAMVVISARDSAFAYFNLHPTGSDVVTDRGKAVGFDLYQNYPNPFNPTTEIRYRISEASFVNLKVHDVLGREVAILVNEMKEAGTYDCRFSALPAEREVDSSQLASGVYYYRLAAGSYVATKQMLLLR